MKRAPISLHLSRKTIPSNAVFPIYQSNPHSPPQSHRSMVDGEISRIDSPTFRVSSTFPATHHRLKDGLNKSLNWVPDDIKRGRDSPLHITLDCTRFTNLYPVLRLIQPHSQRWRSLRNLVSHVSNLPSVLARFSRPSVLARFSRISTSRLQGLTRPIFTARASFPQPPCRDSCSCSLSPG